MSILIDKSTRLVVQGITGRDGLFHAKMFICPTQMIFLLHKVLYINM